MMAQRTIIAFSPDGHERVLKTKEEGVPVRAGSVFDVRSGGGGGWGAPDRRSNDGRRNDEEAGLPPLTDRGAA